MPRDLESLSYQVPWQATFVRPLAVTILAWIGMVWGALGVICGGVGLLMGQLMLARVSAFSGVSTNWDVSQLAQSFVGLAQSIVLLLASLGCLYLRPAARRVIIGYAIFAIAWVVGMTLMHHLLWRRGNAPPNAAAIGAVMLFLALLLSCALPVAILLVMTRPRVREAFATGGIVWYACSYPPSIPAATQTSSSANDLQTS